MKIEVDIPAARAMDVIKANEDEILRFVGINMNAGGGTIVPFDWAAVSDTKKASVLKAFLRQKWLDELRRGVLSDRRQDAQRAAQLALDTDLADLEVVETIPDVSEGLPEEPEPPPEPEGP